MRILQGIHAGEAGVVTDIEKHDGTHASILMDDTKQELKVLITNLRRKEEMNPSLKHTLSSIFFQGENQSTALKEKGQTVKEVYSAGDLVIFDGHQKLGLVLQVQPDSLKVLLESN